jgi:hypothetical protein
LPAGSNETGADFDDDAHSLCWLLPARLKLLRWRMTPAWETRRPGGEGQHLYPAVRMALLAR